MITKTTMTLLTATLLVTSASASARVTYEDAVKDQKAYNEKLKMAEAPPAHAYTQDELDNIDTSEEWKEVWSGGTTGEIPIPSNAKMLSVETSAGTFTFPTNTPLTIVTVKDGGSKYRASAVFTGTSVKGDNNNNGATGDNQFHGASVSIKKIFIQE